MKEAREETEKDREYMREAIQAMRRAGVIDKTGGPFGAVIVLGGKIVAVCGNTVVKDFDPSAHAEMNAIRSACKTLRSFHLQGAILYSTCECCPMCYAAAYWARISKIYYAASWDDYSDLFDDSKIHQEMSLPYPQRLLSPQQILREEAVEVWREFRTLPGGARY